MCIKVLLRAGSYLIFLSTISCTWEQMTPQIDCEISPIEIEILENNGTECGKALGSFTVSASGGESPYEFTSGSGTSPDGTFTNLGAGTYAVAAIDAKGCEVKLDVTVQNLDGVNLDGVETNVSGCGSSNGAIQVFTSGGVEPYLFSLNGGNTQPGNTFSGLAHGVHTVSIKDQEGCEIKQEVAVTSGVSYKKSIQAIIQNGCAVSGCHAGSVSPDLRTYEEIKVWANAIKTRTGNGSMPKDATLPQDEIDMIACWVNDGALSN